MARETKISYAHASMRMVDLCVHVHMAAGSISVLRAVHVCVLAFTLCACGTKENGTTNGQFYSRVLHEFTVWRLLYYTTWLLV